VDYGVGFGVAEHPLGPYRDEWSAEGPAVLRGVPDRVLGPGHASVVKWLDDKTEFLVYHAWDVQPDFEHPRCAGPTFDTQTLELP
jgi:hypothetical protein